MEFKYGKNNNFRFFVDDMEESGDYYPGSPYGCKGERHAAANIRERKRMLRSVPRSDILKLLKYWEISRQDFISETLNSRPELKSSIQ